MSNPNPDQSNLVPFTSGDDPRRNNGRPKGAKNWSTVVQDLLENEEFLDKLYKKKPDWFEHLPKKNGHAAVAAAMMVKSLKGDEKAAKWLRETGYGNKLDVTSDGKPIQPIAVIDLSNANKQETK